MTAPGGARARTLETQKRKAAPSWPHGLGWVPSTYFPGLAKGLGCEAVGSARAARGARKGVAVPVASPRDPLILQLDMTRVLESLHASCHIA